nr:hypothetical protein [Tanacetum cinerariifolium]
MKGILRQYSIARTNQQNGVAERRNRTLIKAARTMLADSNIPTTFWAKAVNTACYVQNRVFIVKPRNKTQYELFHGRIPALSFMKPFGCPVTIFNTLDHLGKFNGKADEGFFVGYSLSSKAFRVFNSRKRIAEEILHVRFCKNTPNVVGSGPDWLFDIDALTRTLNYEPIIVGTQSNGFAGTKACDNAGQARKEKEFVKDYIFLPLWTVDLPFSQDLKSSQDDGFQPSINGEKKVDEDLSKGSECRDQEQDDNVNNTNIVNAASTNGVNVVSKNISNEFPFDPNMPALEDVSTFNFLSDHEDDDEEADMDNIGITIQVSHVPNTRIHKDHPLDQEELLQFKLQEVLVDLPNRKRAIGTKWVFQNKKDERGIMIRNKERLVAQGHTQEKGIDYDEVFTPIARIEAIRLFLAYASFKDFVVYQMDVKSAFLYGKIKEEVYVCQPPGFEDPYFLDKMYKVEKHYMDYIKLLKHVYADDIIFGSTKKEICIVFEKMMHEKFQMSFMGELTFFLGLQVKQKQDGIFINQDKYVTKILKKCGFTEVKNASTPMETQKPMLKDEDGEEVDVYMYRYQVNLKVSHLHAMKRIFSDYAGSSLDRKSTTGGCQFLGCRLISWQCKKHTVVANSTTKVEYVAASSCCGQVLWIQNQLLDYGMKLNELMELCTTLQSRVLDLENTKTTQALEIDSLKKMVKKLEKNLGEDASKQGRISDINADEVITLVSTHDDVEMFDADKDLHGEEVFVVKQDENVIEKGVDAAQVQISTAATTATISIDEVTLA